jgi:hypothetical protein
MGLNQCRRILILNLASQSSLTLFKLASSMSDEHLTGPWFVASCTSAALADSSVALRASITHQPLQFGLAVEVTDLDGSWCMVIVEFRV